MEHKLSHLKQLKQIKLSDEERAYLRGRLAQAVMSPAPAVPSIFMRGVQHGLSIALSSFLFVIFVGGSMSAVASKALPGDPLYAYKRKINEEIRAALLNSPEERAAFAQARVESRVEEIKTLAQTKTLTKEKQAIARRALDENIQDLSVQLSTLSEESPNTALSVTADLEQDLKEDKQAIENTLTLSSDNEAAAATLETIEGTLRKVSEQEVKIITKQIQSISDELQKTRVDAPNLVNAKGDVLGDTADATEASEDLLPTTPASP